MATKSLQDQFFTSLFASKSYQLLSPEEQVRLRQMYENATDEQLRSGLEELKRNALAVEQFEHDKKAQQEVVAENAKKIKKSLTEAEKTDLQENIQADTLQSQEDADKLITSLDKEDSSQKKKKKFLGIF